METKRLYECLILIDPALAAASWEGITGKITKQMEKRGGEIVSLKKWDERQLAYEIDKKSRGTYVLVYFKSEPDAIVAMERDITLSEDIMRAMFLRADFIKSDEQMDKEAPTVTDFRYRGGNASEDGWKEKSWKARNNRSDNNDDAPKDSDAPKEAEAEKAESKSEKE